MADMTAYRYFILVIMFACYTDAFTIDIPLGRMEGLRKDIAGAGPLYKFLNIPYAKAPVGKLRFSKPAAYGSWTGTLNATTYGPSCMQDHVMFPFPNIPNKIIDEDCLFLNIFAPLDTDSTSNRTVMVWIHGGAYIFGQGMAYDATNLAMVGNVVVVTVNYRLGAFGFFYTGDSNAPGNYGLWDQKLALEWVYKNIRWFGGNPNSVTIFGESAGGFSVSIMSINPQMRGLFKRVIAQSGDATALVAVSEPSKLKESYKAFISTAGCSSDPLNTSVIIDCLRNLPATTILSAQRVVQEHGPTVDGEFILDHPLSLLKDTTSDSYSFFTSLDFISGTNSADGSVFLGYAQYLAPSNEFSLADGMPTNHFCDALIPKFVESQLSSYTNINNALCETYKDTSSMAGQGEKFVDMCGDVFLLVPSIQSLNAHSHAVSTGKTYQYLFARTNTLVKTFIPRYTWVTGAAHGDELVFLFGMEELAKQNGIQLSPYDVIFIRQMTEYWTNFAKTGNPNGGNLPIWPEYNQTDKKYFLFGCQPTEESAVYADRVKFWLEDVHSLGTSTPGPSNSASKIYRQHVLTIIFSLPAMIMYFML